MVTCLEMLEHVPDPASVVAAAAPNWRSLGPGCFQHDFEDAEDLMRRHRGRRICAPSAAKGHMNTRAS